MADFKTHITVSTTLGVAYGAVAFKHFGLPAPTCILAGTLCSVSGMLPDLDSDSGVPLRESLAFAAACVPLLMFDRLRATGWSNEVMVLAGAAMYVAVRFGIGKLLKKYTVHRGMFHSLPAAVIAGEIAFLLCVSGDIYLRIFKAGAVVAGFMSHLILDEIWSVKVQGGRIGLKSSSGTAVKLWGDSGWANLSCYGKMILFGFLVMKDPIWETVSPEAKELHDIASTVVGEASTMVGKFEQRANTAMPVGTPTWFGAAPTTPTASAPYHAAAPTPWPNNYVDAAGYAAPNPPPTYAAPNVAPLSLPQPYSPPTYGSPPPYVPPQPYVPVQPYAPTQPYVLPPSQQAQTPGYVPYDSPRY